MNDTMKHSKQSREINEAVGACPCCGSSPTTGSDSADGDCIEEIP